jgi:glycyl-tRNA synthetase
LLQCGRTTCLRIIAPDTKNTLTRHFCEGLVLLQWEEISLCCCSNWSTFRNEISHRQGLLRVCEFTLAEIEHFVDPGNKSHPKFSDVANFEFLMFPREEQMSGQSAKKLCLGEVVAKGTVNKETVGYFIARVYLFLVRLGTDKEQLRFRQHFANEMARYAADCLDAEFESSYGWIECVGIADRSAFDLRAHSVRNLLLSCIFFISFDS